MKKVFYVMAASLALASCADENIGFENQNLQDGSMVAVEDLNLVFNRGSEEGSRALWNPTTTEGGLSTLSFAWENVSGVNTDKIGLVYVGQGGKLGITNYEFALDSLQLADYKVAATPGTVVGKDGKTYNRTTGYYAVGANQTDVAYTKTDGSALVAADFLSSKSAKFMTNYDAIMKGHYVTYSPYNAAYKNSGTAIPVTGVERLKVSAEATNLQALGKATFAYSSPMEVAAGKQATYFDMKPLTNVFAIKIINIAKFTNAKNLKSVVLRAKGEDKFVTSGTLVDPSVAPSYANMTAGDKTSTLFVDYAAGSYLTLEAGQEAPAADAEFAPTNLDMVYFPVLPTTFAAGGFDVILIDENNFACVLDVNFQGTGNVTTAAGTYYEFSVTVDGNTKFDQSFITTPEDLQDIINTARIQTSTTTINLLGSIESDDLNVVNNNNVEENRNWKGGLIINGSTGSTLTLNNPQIKMWDNGDNSETFKCESLTINAPVVINGGQISGRVIVNDVTFKGTVNLGAYYTTYGHYSFFKINGDATVEKDAVLNVVYGRNHRPALYGFTGGLHIAEGATLTVEEGGSLENKNLKFSDYTFRSDIVVDGTLTIENKASFDNYGDTSVGATGKLIVNGTATNYNNIIVKGGTFEVAGTLANEASKAAGSEGVNNGAQSPDVRVESGKLESKTTGVISNKHSLNVAGTFVNGGAFYDYVGSVYGGSPFSSNGKYACYVNSQERLLEAVNRLNIYAADKYQELILQTATYELDAIAAAKAAKLNLVNDGDITLAYDDEDAVVTFNSLTVQGEDEVTIEQNINFAGTTIAETTVAPISIAAGAKLIIENNITVKANGAIVNAGTFDLKNAATVNDIPANVYCTSADVTTGKWTNYPIITTSDNFWN